MKSIFSSRRNKSPHNNEEAEKKEAPFFSKANKSPFFNNPKGAVQPKLTVGQPNDKYEKEADSMADAVVSNSSSKPDIQNKDISSIQRESLATPLEDEKLGTAEQRMEEDKLIQEKSEIQKMDEPEEEEGVINKMQSEEEEEGSINKMDEEKEEEDPAGAVQTKSNTSNQKASSGLSQQLKGKAGKGKSLSADTQAEMESSFGRDFSDVNIHTDKDAVNMNQELGAQAFTHGKDVYFNSGKYNPETSSGKHLLAHELTHVVQQNQSLNQHDFDKSAGVPAVQKKSPGNSEDAHKGLLDQYSKVSGIPREEVSQHQPGYQQWLSDMVSQKAQISVKMFTPSKNPKPDHSKSKDQISAWEQANFRFKPQFSISTDKISINNAEHSFVKSIDYRFIKSNFDYFIAKEIYESTQDKSLEPTLRIGYMRLYRRIQKHSRGHFNIYRQVVENMKNELISHLTTLPGKKNPILISQKDLDTYLEAYLVYFTAKLRYKLWKRTCMLEKKDYPNLLKGLASFSGSFKVNCGPKPKVPKMPLLPIVIRSKTGKKSK